MLTITSEVTEKTFTGTKLRYKSVERVPQSFARNRRMGSSATSEMLSPSAGIGT
jgi:hypothetical protein